MTVMKTRKNTVALFVAILCLCSCRPDLVILHTNDTHSHMDPVRGGSYDGLGGCIERAAFVDSVRAAEGEDRVLLLHAGDFSQGTTYFSQLNGQLEPRIIKAMRYDCVTLGNHEFDNGIEALCERVRMLGDVPVVCANLDLSSFKLGEYVKPYAIVTKAGMKIGIIGMEADISWTVSKTVSSRIPVLDNVEVVRKWEDFLHDECKCDLIILLSHMGFEEDLEIVPKTKWVDVVVGGHTHTFLKEKSVERNMRGKQVPVVTDGCWGIQMGKLSLYRGLFSRLSCR